MGLSKYKRHPIEQCSSCSRKENWYSFPTEDSDTTSREQTELVKVKFIVSKSTKSSRLLALSTSTESWCVQGASFGCQGKLLRHISCLETGKVVYSEHSRYQGLPKVFDLALSNAPAFPAIMYPLILTVVKLWSPMLLPVFIKSTDGVHEEKISICAKKEEWPLTTTSFKRRNRLLAGIWVPGCWKHLALSLWICGHGLLCADQLKTLPLPWYTHQLPKTAYLTYLVTLKPFGKRLNWSTWGEGKRKGRQEIFKPQAKLW